MYFRLTRLCELPEFPTITCKGSLLLLIICDSINSFKTQGERDNIKSMETEDS